MNNMQNTEKMTTLENLMKENREVLIRLATKGNEYYTVEQFKKDFERIKNKNSSNPR